MNKICYLAKLAGGIQHHRKPITKSSLKLQAEAEVDIDIDMAVQPKLVKARPGPPARRDWVNQEIVRQEDSGTSAVL